jgi:hypothetical protein
VVTRNVQTGEGYVIRGMDAATIDASARFCVLARVRDIRVVTTSDAMPAGYADRLKTTVTAVGHKAQRIVILGVSTDLDDKSKAPLDVGYTVYAISDANEGAGLAVAFDRSRRIESELTEFAFVK